MISQNDIDSLESFINELSDKIDDADIEQNGDRVIGWSIFGHNRIKNEIKYIKSIIETLKLSCPITES
jgi:hypothetical protein